ncbi:MAG: SCP2 sterol-binding domain-containing protein [Deinococcales bacterium]
MNPLDTLSQKITPEVKAQLDAVIGLELDGVAYTFDVRKEGAGLLEGTAQNHGLTPRVTLKSSKQDFEKLLAGELNPMMAAMTGKLKLEGDMGFAMSLTKLFG